MASATPQTRFDSNMASLERCHDNGEIAAEDYDAIKKFIGAYHPDNLMETPPEGETTLSVGSCNLYLTRLKNAAQQFTLVDASTDDVNAFLQEMKEAGRANDTINGYSSTFRKFYDLLDVNVDPSALASVKESNGSSFDPDDILTRGEVDELMRAADHPRDRAIFALLIYTGMRSFALRTLRIKDVDVQEGRWKFNEEHSEGLKGADKRGVKRPLLDARGPVRDWLNYHPHKDDPDAYLITAHPKYGSPDPDKPVASSTIRRCMDRLVENTDNPDIERKPTHPHMMRHNFVTICRREYDMDEATIKHLLGHAKTSQIFETTYSHLSDEDFNTKAEVAAGLRDEEAESTFTPRSCSVCAQPLPADAKACTCGNPVTPDAAIAQKEVQQDVGAARVLNEGADLSDLSQEELEDIAQDDAILGKLIEIRAEMADS